MPFYILKINSNSLLFHTLIFFFILNLKGILFVVLGLRFELRTSPFRMLATNLDLPDRSLPSS
jgi:hypothetical protein